ncbi:MAG: ATP-dependent DNA helicase RecG [Gammaproteobacteria bacterium]|nr:MAG: ATP-dependent DNA helicase RecG [Gammaproteobacteria bacterium]
MDLSNISLDHLKGVAAKQCERLAKLGIYNLQDMLLHLPLRYEDRTRQLAIGSITAGMQVVVEGQIELSEVIPGRKRMLVCRLSDGTGSIDLRFFNFYNSQKNQLARGATVRCFCEVRRGRQRLEMIHPEYSLVDPNDPPQPQTTLTPVYPTTEGLRQLSLRQLVNQALALVNSSNLRELIAPDLLATKNLPAMPLLDAILFIHNPPADADQVLLQQSQHPCQKRLVIEELLAHQLTMLKLKRENKQHQAFSLPREPSLLAPFLGSLPFSPTSAQTRVYQDIAEDIEKNVPMMRLVQGDVGSGKTLVAAMAAIQALEAGKQVALMAPTELLAEQHANNFQLWLKPLGFEVAWLSGKVTGKARGQVNQAITSGQATMIVGTHALFQQSVEFHSLALIIVDEQHRFGVHQRLALREKGRQDEHYPHQLIMTATPIPRTLAMSAYADLDSSVIDELPPGRTPVATIAMSDQRRQDLIHRVQAACEDEGRQVYWVCTLIEESENLQCQAAEDTHQLLSEQLSNLSIGLIHGRMKSKEKIRIMEQFKAGEIDLLVATTVIEVGVDVPNASLMVIENSERLGLAQLHQLRGRVGRGSVASHCVLFYKQPLSNHGKQRIEVLRQTNDGFVIAEKDLELRGPGEVLGTRQTGLAEFKIADIYRDRDLLPKAYQLATSLLQNAPSQVPLIIDRWLGNKEQYGKV